MITGSFITRTQGNDSGHARKNSALVAIVGVIEVPNDSPFNSEGHQFQIHGHDTRCFLSGDLIADHQELTRGMAIGSLITEPIWRT